MIATENPVVLFVEDSDLDFEMAERALHSDSPKVDVLRAESLSQVMEHIDDKALTLIIFDINMGSTNGLKLLAEVRSECQRTDVGFIVFSTSTSPNEKRSALDAGAGAYHEKPLGAVAFMEAVRQMVLPWIEQRLQ
ncbi:MAG: response regulator [Planctomycetales bacterium]|nr:response regulator [Planctomycetales bacterium]